MGWGCAGGKEGLGFYQMPPPPALTPASPPALEGGNLVMEPKQSNEDKPRPSPLMLLQDFTTKQPRGAQRRQDRGWC